MKVSFTRQILALTTAATLAPMACKMRQARSDVAAAPVTYQEVSDVKLSKEFIIREEGEVRVPLRLMQAAGFYLDIFRRAVNGSLNKGNLGTSASFSRFWEDIKVRINKTRAAAGVPPETRFDAWYIAIQKYDTLECKNAYKEILATYRDLFERSIPKVEEGLKVLDQALAGEVGQPGVGQAYALSSGVILADIQSTLRWMFEAQTGLYGMQYPGKKEVSWLNGNWFAEVKDVIVKGAGDSPTLLRQIPGYIDRFGGYIPTLKMMQQRLVRKFTDGNFSLEELGNDLYIDFNGNDLERYIVWNLDLTRQEKEKAIRILLVEQTIWKTATVNRQLTSFLSEVYGRLLALKERTTEVDIPLDSFGIICTAKKAHRTDEQPPANLPADLEIDGGYDPATMLGYVPRKYNVAEENEIFNNLKLKVFGNPTYNQVRVDELMKNRSTACLDLVEVPEGMSSTDVRYNTLVAQAEDKARAACEKQIHLNQEPYKTLYALTGKAKFIKCDIHDKRRPDGARQPGCFTVRNHRCEQ